MSDFATIDLSGFEAFGKELLEVIEEHGISEVAKTHTREIQNLTMQGYDAQGNTFHAYNPEYALERAAAGYDVNVKDLRRDKGRLYDLKLEDDTLTVPDDAQQIALGQMTGHDGAWGYEHDFLDTSAATDELAGEELTEFIAEHIGA